MLRELEDPTFKVFNRTKYNGSSGKLELRVYGGYNVIDVASFGYRFHPVFPYNPVSTVYCTVYRCPGVVYFGLFVSCASSFLTSFLSSFFSFLSSSSFCCRIFLGFLFCFVFLFLFLFVVLSVGFTRE